MAGTGKSDVHLLLVCTAERGLCGGFNANIAKLAREHADRLIRDGKIAAVGRDVKIPKWAIRIDAAGKHVAPGLLAANSDL
ncbi:MAG: hypothetical protein ACO3US_08085, partial [Ilumatobacteraceae bacterium]